MKWFHAARARLRLLRRNAAESRIDEELHFHIEMETERLIREEKLDHAEARRRALVAFGGVQQHRETLRDGRGTAWLGGLSLDLKLGWRMLAKYPGLTVVGGLAMAFGIWFGAVTFQMFSILSGTSLPLPEGDRIVKIQTWDLKASQDEDRVLYDYQFWRTARSITDIGAYRESSANLVGADGGAKPEVAAEITASAFRIAPARPLMGRVLNESDERAGAEPVVLIGHGVWTRRFDGDPQIIGRTVQIGNSFATVVGVMPEGFAFPVAHDVWLPLRTDVAVEPLRGGSITVFGRLAPGITFENAQAELTSLGKRLAAEHPATHAQLQPKVISYTKWDANPDEEMGLVMALTYFFIVALVMVVCSTVALLLFARAASRETELIVRSALGASRTRIVMQLFAEALVLAGVAAVVGLAMAQLALTRWGGPYLKVNYGRLPFWYDFNLSPTTIVFGLLLAVLSAVVAGAMPARRITRGLGSQLRAGTAGGGGVSFGGVWTAVIVIQIALTVALPAVVLLMRGEQKRVSSYDAGFPMKEYLGVALSVEGEPAETVTSDARAALNTRIGASLEALRGRLETEPGVTGVTFVDKLPGEWHDFQRLELVSVRGSVPRAAATASIDPAYFKVLQAPILAGRAFTTGDLSPDARVVIVDKGFVDLVMGGRNPIGHRVRISSCDVPDSAAAMLPWYEIVGLVKELGMASASNPRRAPGVYLPASPGSPGGVHMIVRGQGDPLSMAPRVRELAMAIDPAIRVEKMLRLDQVTADFLWFIGLWMKMVMGLTAVALLLSLAGIYSVLSYTVARRTREIGVRVALGASAPRVITSIFKRPLIQVTLGVIAGSVLIAVMSVVVGNTTQFSGTGIAGFTLGDVPLLAAYAVLMLAVCMLACVAPTVRALRVQPMEALRTE